MSVIDNPKVCVREFFDCISNEDYAGADRYVSNYASLGLGGEAPDDALTGYLSQRLFDSYRVEFLNDDFDSVSGNVERSDYSVDGRNANVTFRFSVLNVEKLSAVLEGYVSEIGSQHAKSGEEITEETAMAIFDEAVARLEQNPDGDFVTTTEMTVDLVYVNGMWQLIVDNDFYYALMGRLQTEVSASDVSGGDVQ